AWLALPLRLDYFIWYAGPKNNIGVNHTFREGCEFYWGGMLGEYHFAPVAAYASVALALLGLAAIMIRRTRPAGWVALPCVFLVSGLMTVIHPNHQMRFLHTWLPVLWIMAGLGVAALVRAVAALTSRGTASVAGALALVLVAVVLWPGLSRPGYA